jgi:putative transposase
MKKSRFTDSQILAVLKQAEAGTPVPQLCREHGISSATFYKWRSKFGGMDASLMSQLKELQDENRRLKKMYADAQLSAELLKEAMAKKWCGHLNAGRWPDGQWKAGARASGTPARPLP